MTVDAVVVGLCAHGLAVARALGRRGVKVTALEARADLPGTRTRWARVRLVPDINGPGLVAALEALLPRRGADALPVLFLTNDNMVRVVAEHWERLSGRCRLSWAPSRREVARFLDKGVLEARCLEVGLSYPRTVLVTALADARAAAEALRPPLIVKPARPLSSFKARVCPSAPDAEAVARRFPADLPLLFQEYVPGDDGCLRFGAVYLAEGRVLARFEGRKLRSYPPGRGGTSAAEALPDDRVHRATLRFFEGLGLSGPASLEVKVDPVGHLWVIEPTVGRTDYWVDCCVANGVNIPLTEYRHQIGAAVEGGAPTRAYVWFDSERDKRAVLSIVRRSPGTGWKPRFSYWAPDDGAPFRTACARFCRDAAARVGRRVLRAGRRGAGGGAAKERTDEGSDAG